MEISKMHEWSATGPPEIETGTDFYLNLYPLSHRGYPSGSIGISLT